MKLYVLKALCFRSTEEGAIVFVRTESNKEGLREMTSKLHPTGWGRLCIPARTAIGARDGAIASVNLFRRKGLTEKRKVDLGLCPKGNRKPWPDFICELAWSDLCFVEMTLTLVMEHGWQGIEKVGRMLS